MSVIGEENTSLETLNFLFKQLDKHIVGQKNLQKRLVMALLLKQHILLEGLPGLAKTTAVKALAKVSGLQFNRIQFTPDIMPSDILGGQVFNPKTVEFQTRKGPVFTNLLIADEINRAPAKAQSALLEAMQERQVSIGDESIKLPDPFMVLATQNPLDQEGTYSLPEAQVDRFLFKLKVEYPSYEEELEVMRRSSQKQESVQTNTKDSPGLGVGEIKKLSDQLEKVHVEDPLRKYILNIVAASREPEKFGLLPLKSQIYCGASPRASIGLEMAARASAFFAGRSYVTPQDVKDVAMDVLRHRILISMDALMQGHTSEEIITEILKTVPIQKLD